MFEAIFTAASSAFAECPSCLISFTSLPVSTFTGHNIAHRLSVAQVSSPQYLYLVCISAAICGVSPLFIRRCISLKVATLCLGESVNPSATQVLSQKPHSIHLLMISLLSGQGFKFDI